MPLLDTWLYPLRLSQNRFNFLRRDRSLEHSASRVSIEADRLHLRSGYLESRSAVKAFLAVLPQMLPPGLEVSLGAGDQKAVPVLTVADEFREDGQEAEVGVDGLEGGRRRGGQVVE